MVPDGAKTDNTDDVMSHIPFHSIKHECGPKLITS